MPTYHALGISASIKIIELTPTLTRTLEPRHGKSRQADLPRIKDVFSHGTELPERSVGLEIGDSRALQYIGECSDLPLVMVEAGQHLKQHWVHRSLARRSLPSPSSVITASGPGNTLASVNTSLRSDSPMIDQTQYDAQSDDYEEASEPYSNVENDEEPRAMQIAVGWTDKSYISGGSSKIDNLDLKIEIFVNGILFGVTFQSRRYTSTEQKEKSYQLSGIRCHRQVEKPFLYQPQTAEEVAKKQRWEAISESLQDEAEQRGVDKRGNRPPSADYLLALANLRISDSPSLKNASLGVVDVVFTAGHGRKYGPETSYSMTCTRMENAEFCKASSTLIGTPVQLTHNDTTSSSTPLDSSIASPVETSSPEIPLIDQVKGRIGSTSVAGDTTYSSHGFTTMLRPSQPAIPTAIRTSGPSTIPAQHRNNQAESQTGHFATPPKSGTRELTNVVVGTSSLGTLSSPRRTRSSHRALQDGAEPPKKSGNKRRKLTDVPMFPPLKAQNTSSSPLRQGENVESESYGPEGASIAPPSSCKPSRRRIQETTPDQAVRDFEIPELLSQGPVTVADSDESFRQIAKERKGEFKEDSVVVGMRFIIS